MHFIQTFSLTGTRCVGYASSSFCLSQRKSLYLRRTWNWLSSNSLLVVWKIYQCIYTQNKGKIHKNTKFYLSISHLGLNADSSFREQINTYQYIIKQIHFTKHIINWCQFNYQVGSYFSILYYNYFTQIADSQLTRYGLPKALSRYENHHLLL